MRRTARPWIFRSCTHRLGPRLFRARAWRGESGWWLIPDTASDGYQPTLALLHALQRRCGALGTFSLYSSGPNTGPEQPNVGLGGPPSEASIDESYIQSYIRALRAPSQSHRLLRSGQRSVPHTVILCNRDLRKRILHSYLRSSTSFLYFYIKPPWQIPITTITHNKSNQEN